MPVMGKRMSWVVWSLLALAALGLLLRNVLAIPVLAPLDPNEGWNAAHALSLTTRGALYPPPGSLMVNNYPPLSFYVVTALTRLTGDTVIAGRLLSLLSFLLVCAAIALICRQMACGTRARLYAMLFFAAVLLIGSDYVAMDDPQLLGHALQLGGLLLLLRKRIFLAGTVFAISLFVKHNLVALPLAASIWLLWRDRRAGLQLLLCGGASAALGLLLFHHAYGTALLPLLSSPRLVSWANVRHAASQLWWAVLPLGFLAAANHPWKDFCRIYAVGSLAIGLVFSAGDGVDTNAFFDLALACCLAVGLDVEHGRNPAFASLCAAPLPLFLALHFHDNNFFFTHDFRAQSARDIIFLKSRSGPALCDQLSLCLWAGKGAQVDVFNAGEQIKTGARDPSALASMIAARHFAVVQLQELDAMGPVIHTAITENYRLHHGDDNGNFLVPARRAP